MKWIGQHIYDQISRFRSGVYLEDISTGTIASGGNLGLDSNNKIVKANEATGDITGVALTAGTGVDLTSVSGATGGAYAATIGVDVSDFMTNGADNYVLTATGADAMNAEANLTFSGTQLSARILGSPGFLIEHTSSNNAYYGLKLNQSTPSLGIAVDHNETRTAGVGGRGFMVDYDKTAVLADGETGVYTGINVSLYDQITNHSGSTFTQTGHYTDVVSVGSTGAMTNIGYDASIGNLGGGGTNIGFRSNTWTAGGIDFYSLGETALHAVGSTDDYFKIVTHIDGLTTLTTHDEAGTAAHFEIAADGDITLDSAGQIKLEPVAGNNILLDGTVTVDGGSVTGITTLGVDSVSLTAVQTSAEPFADNDTSIMTSGALDNRYALRGGNFELSGYAVSDGSNFMIADVMSGNKAPFQHDDASVGSDGLTAVTPSLLLRVAGTVMPYAGTFKLWKGWGASAGSGTVDISIFKYTPTAGDATLDSLVLVKNTQFTAGGNSVLRTWGETSFSVAFAAGDILITGIKGSGSSKAVYFTSTIEVEWT